MSQTELIHETVPSEFRVNGEASPAPHDKGLRLITPQTALDSENISVFTELMDARTKFVEDMGWLPDRKAKDDSDRYDFDPNTMHFVKLRANGTVEEGMRLTKVDDAKDSLSVEMLRGNPEVFNKALRFTEKLKGKDVWDLTRLIQPLDGSVDDFDILAGYLELFGAGLKRTESATQTWIYVTTQKIKNVLDFVGIQQEVVASGKLSVNDIEDSYFCVVDMNAAYRYLQDNREDERIAFTAEKVEHGRAQADSL